MKSKNNVARTRHLIRGSVLDELGFSTSEALEIKVKAEIYRELLQYIKDRKFTQQELARKLGIHQPDVSNLLGGKVSKFSVSKLIKFAGNLDLGARITLTKTRVAKLSKVVTIGKSQKRAPTLA